MSMVWCTVRLCDGSENEYSVSSCFLKMESGEKVSMKDLIFGNKIIWMTKGKPFEVEVLEMHGKFFLWMQIIMYLSVVSKNRISDENDGGDDELGKMMF